ncbi:MAG: hypothetical protein V3V00_03560 [Saprospiraceae bacterium]
MNLLKAVLLLIYFCIAAQNGTAQSFMFGPKIGGTLGTQSWSGIERDFLFAYHGAFFIESWSEDSKSSFFTQLGYHQRGSSQRTFNFVGGTNSQSFVFNNAVLAFGVKKRINTYSLNKPYYILGLRLEYTLNTNLNQYLIYGGYFPLDPFVNKFNYGALAGIGYEMQFSEFVGAFVEATLSPDISLQYEQPVLNNIIDPISRQTRNLPQQMIRNISFEVSIGLRLLRKIEFID